MMLRPKRCQGGVYHFVVVLVLVVTENPFGAFLCFFISLVRAGALLHVDFPRGLAAMVQIALVALRCLPRRDG
ncbi:hypothetical protein B0T10DRAFT_276688 [Thelonectria olida]|uniref:Uncharacterized protein n=1 Tax=Thelonectria olida TaxID=1576542 RepID=A0A9P8WAK3_9HYPO|nr:hypothetical protein B0T10DRAFT_276688 [Thelonectria olida]